MKKNEKQEIQGNPKDIVQSLKSIKEFKNILITTGDDPLLEVTKLAYDIPMLDDLLSGGLPFGRIVLMYGESSVGKTFLTQKLVGRALEKFKTVGYIDTNKTYHPEWWRFTGVAIPQVIVARPNYGEQAFTVAIQMLASGIDVLIMDDIDMLVPLEEGTLVEDPAKEGSRMGLQAKMITIGVRNLLRHNEKALIILLNHAKEGIGAYAGHYLPGGKAQKDISSIGIWLTRGPTIRESDITEGGDDKKRAGFKIRVTLEKDKVGGKQFDFCEIPFIFKDGAIDNIYTLVEVAMDLGIITKNAATYQIFGKKVVGILKLRTYLKDNPDVQERLTKEIKEIKPKCSEERPTLLNS